MHNRLLSEKEREDIKASGYEFSKIFLEFLDAGFDKLVENASKKKQKIVFCLTWMKIKFVTGINEFGERELFRGHEPITFILNSEPPMFLNTLCFKLDTINGKVEVLWALPQSQGWENFKKGALFECKTVMDSCEKYLKFLVNDSRVRGSAFNDVDPEDLEDVRKRLTEATITTAVKTKFDGIVI